MVLFRAQVRERRKKRVSLPKARLHPRAVYTGVPNLNIGGEQTGV